MLEYFKTALWWPQLYLLRSELTSKELPVLKRKVLIFETYLWSFSCISSASMPQNHGSSSESRLTEDTRLDSFPKESLLSLSGAK